MDVSIIIINYNTVKLTNECVASVFRMTGGLEFEVIVIDNGSTDGSYEILSNVEYKNYRYLFNDTNTGFPKACNQGADLACGRYLFFLNSDTVFLNNVPGLLFEYLQCHAEAGIAGPQFFNTDMSLQVSCRRFPSIGIGLIKFFPFLSKVLRSHRREYYMPDLNSNVTQYVDTVSAGALMISKKLFNIIGKFDETNFMYGEDADICRRVRDGGQKVTFFPEARLIHYGGQSSQLNSRKAIWSYYMAFYHLYKTYYFKRFALLVKPLFVTRALLEIILNVFRKNKRITWNN